MAPWERLDNLSKQLQRDIELIKRGIERNETGYGSSSSPKSNVPPGPCWKILPQLLIAAYLGCLWPVYVPCAIGVGSS
jgi:hypothetical protein